MKMTDATSCGMSFNARMLRGKQNVNAEDVVFH